MDKKQKLYTLPSDVKRTEMAGHAFWMKDIALCLIVLATATIDGVTLYVILDKGTMFETYQKIIMVAGCAIALNFIPLIAGRLIHYYRYGMKGIKRYMLYALAVVFILLFCSVFAVRMTTSENAFTADSGINNRVKGSAIDGGDTGGDDAGGGGTTEINYNAPIEDAAKIAISFLVGILPLITSAINLYVGYISDDPIERRLRNLKYQRAKLENHLSILISAKMELEKDWGNVIADREKMAYNAACETIKRESEHIRALARLALAQKLKTPDSISELTDVHTRAENSEE